MMNKLIYKYLLVVYIALLLFTAYIHGNVAGIDGMTYWEALCHISHFIPFYQYSVRFFLIHLVEFMPLGFLLPKIFLKLETPGYFLVTVVSIIFSYRMIRVLFLAGYFDMTSIFCSSCGAWLVFVAVKKIEHISNSKKDCAGKIENMK